MNNPGMFTYHHCAELQISADSKKPIDTAPIKAEQPHVGLAEVLAIIQLSTAAIDLTEKLLDFIKSRQDKNRVKLMVDLYG